MSHRWHSASSPSLPEHLCSIFSHHFRSMLRYLLPPPSWGLLLLPDPEPPGPAYCTDAGAAFRTLSVTLPGSGCSCSALMSQSSLSLLSPSPFFPPHLHVSPLPPCLPGGHRRRSSTLSLVLLEASVCQRELFLRHCCQMLSDCGVLHGACFSLPLFFF